MYGNVRRRRDAQADLFPRDPVDPNRLTPEQAAKLLSAAAKVRVPVEHITADLESGAPQNPDGTLNLVHYAAWLLKGIRDRQSHSSHRNGRPCGA
ncbi:MAG: hypothetical protein ACYC0X_34150 [Pirellulaceae bacterium]